MKTIIKRLACVLLALTSAVIVCSCSSGKAPEDSVSDSTVPDTAVVDPASDTAESDTSSQTPGGVDILSAEDVLTFTSGQESVFLEKSQAVMINENGTAFYDFSGAKETKSDVYSAPLGLTIGMDADDLIEKLDLSAEQCVLRYSGSNAFESLNEQGKIDRERGGVKIYFGYGEYPNGLTRLENLAIDGLLKGRIQFDDPDYELVIALAVADGDGIIQSIYYVHGTGTTVPAYLGIS